MNNTDKVREEILEEFEDSWDGFGRDENRKFLIAALDTYKKSILAGVRSEVVEMDYPKMLEDINASIETDWGFEMIDCKRMPNAKPYTQKEAEEMADVLGKIYSIAHSIHCSPCGAKYRTQKIKAIGGEEKYDFAHTDCCEICHPGIEGDMGGGCENVRCDCHLRSPGEENKGKE